MAFGKYSRKIIHSRFEGEWSKYQLVNVEDVPHDTTTYVNHYAQGGFEGIKVKKIRQGKTKRVILVFALALHFLRFNRTLKRMGIPQVTEEMFYGGIEALIRELWDQIPEGVDYYVYLRPLAIGIGHSNSIERTPGVYNNKYFDFTILASSLFTDPNLQIKAYVEKEFSRGGKGTTVTVKATGNYGAGLGPEELAQKEGSDQILWFDPYTGHMHEFTTATCFVVQDNTLITPTLDEGTILDGITRKHILEIARGKRLLTVIEDIITLEDFQNGLANKTIREIFTAGTAVTGIQVSEVRIGDIVYELENKDTLKPYFYNMMNRAYCGELNAGWVHEIKKPSILSFSS